MAMKALFRTTNLVLAGSLAGYMINQVAGGGQPNQVSCASSTEKTEVFPVPRFLAGQWNNELGSSMTIFPTSPVKGQFRGHYQTAVGNASGKYDLVGMYHTDDTNTSRCGDNDCTLGW